MACVPGMPCYKQQVDDVIVYTTYPKRCGPTTTPVTYSSDYVIYHGANLPNSGTNTDDTLTTALQKLDNKLSKEAIFAAFIAAIDNDPALKAILCDRIGTC